MLYSSLSCVLTELLGFGYDTFEKESCTGRSGCGGEEEARQRSNEIREKMMRFSSVVFSGVFVP